MIDTGYSKYDYLTECPVRRRLDGRDVRVILPWCMRDQANEIKRVIIDWMDPGEVEVRLDPRINTVAAWCGRQYEEHEARTIWDVLTAAADRAGKHLTAYGLREKE